MKFICLLLAFVSLNTSLPSALGVDILNKVQKCEVTPSWKLNGIDFPKDVSHSEVKIVAFFNVSCDYCRKQLST